MALTKQQATRGPKMTSLKQSKQENQRVIYIKKHEKREILMNHTNKLQPEPQNKKLLTEDRCIK